MTELEQIYYRSEILKNEVRILKKFEGAVPYDQINRYLLNEWNDYLDFKRQTLGMPSAEIFKFEKRER